MSTSTSEPDSTGSFQVAEATIAQLRAALDSGTIASEQLVRSYLARIETFDRAGPLLNAVVVSHPGALAEARASDDRRARGELLGPLDGIPYTAKDSYMVQGFTVAAGSPAFEHLTATFDAFVISRLRSAGAILIGLTNMPPMAAGGMQPGVYGRAESPYNLSYLPAAYGSGSSNGSGAATAASFAAFGLGEETWSSGRSPASNNALCAYTPSWGLISVRGNWPLTPTMDVVVPHTRTMEDLLEVLDVVVADDVHTRGDFWRTQTWIDVPATSTVRPPSYLTLKVTDPSEAERRLAGRRFGVPRMYVNADPEAGTGDDPGVGGSTGRPITTRPSVIDLWQDARRSLETAGAEVVEVDFPVVSSYEGDRPGVPSVTTRGLLPDGYLHAERVVLSAWAWEEFLRANADESLASLRDVDPTTIFPATPGVLPDRYEGFEGVVASLAEALEELGDGGLEDIPHLREGLEGLVRTRVLDLENWMDDLDLDAVIFPAAADVGAADMDVDPDAADHGWRNGVWVANGNLVIRHLGIPTVTVPMGTMADIGMPVGLTFAGRAYDDTALLSLAAAFEGTGHRRSAPPLTPPL
ncbi:amidase [Aeromicrobium sp. CF3.5]|uniref:amidase n=1 Tax=Aeromicrobium sp. CF3.5 TaxID=3373078 RepID=UPI003EE4A4AC